jgi:nicotinamide riboside kinase
MTETQMLQIRHDMFGFYILTPEEAKHEDDGNRSVGFDGRRHFASREEAAQSLAGIVVIDIDDREEQT